jgi:transposase-like protein
MTSEPKTLIEAVRYFAEADVCHDYMRALKFPPGAACPKCGHTELSEVKTRRLIRCKGCRKMFSAKVGTIFEDSPLPLSSWFVAVWCIANMKNGISSCELARALGIRQPSAWFMLHRIRTAMRTKTFKKLSGEVESDETFVGGKSANMHESKREQAIQGRGPVGKAIVHGVLQRGDAEKKIKSQVVAAVVPDTESATLFQAVGRAVERDSAVYTDAHGGYAALVNRYVHQWVDHVSTYVSGRVHTNGLENFWSLLKRGLRGTYIRPSAFHLQKYVDEQVFRFNERGRSDAGRFRLLMEWLIGRRVTYRQLCMVGGCGFMGIE